MLFFLLRRYLFPHKGNLLSFALWISVLGVALGISLLLVVLSVMTGFQGFLEKNYTRISSDLVVIPRQELSTSIPQKLARVRGIAAFTPFNFGQGLVLKDGVGGVVLEGIDLKTASNVTPWDEVWIEKPLFDLQAKNRRWLWIGAQLAKKLKIKVGEPVNVLIADGTGRMVIPFVITAITKFGIYDHDLRYAKADFRVLREIFKTAAHTMYKCRLAEGFNLKEVMRVLKESLGPSVSVKGWDEINQNIFLAVQHQKRTLFLILEILVALSALNIVSLLMMSAYHRRKDVAILRAMGMKFSSVLTFFLLQGTIVAVLGIALGLGLGVLVCHVVERFQPPILSESIYNVTKLPIRITLSDVGLLSLAALSLCLLFSVLPAMRTSFERPVKALRYE